MTLTSIIPSLRRTIPDPININLWPEHTTVTTTDVIVSGVSMLRLEDICDTPCVHTAAAVLPGTGGRASLTKQAAVVVVTVTAVVSNPDGRRTVVIDGCLDRIPVAWDELRLIGRASTSYRTAATLRSGGDCDTQGSALLPSDVEVGDLLAIPCPEMVVLRDVR